MRSQESSADLHIKVRTLNSITLVAPYLGLAGTSIGLITGLTGVGIQAESALVAVSAVVQVAFVTTIAGLLVAIPAAVSCNYLCTRLDLLEREIFSNVGLKASAHSTGSKKIRFPGQFSTIPFPLVATPILAILVGYVAMVYSSYQIPTGLEIRMPQAKVRCGHEGNRLVVLHVTDSGKLFLNYERVDWNRLAARLSEIYGLRVHRTLYLLADDEVPFQQVADAVDIVTNTSLVGASHSQRIAVRLVTQNPACHCLETDHWHSLCNDIVVPKSSHPSRKAPCHVRPLL